MDEYTALDIMVRLRRVERENRRLKQIGLGILALVVALLLMGRSHLNRVVEAEKFILKDADGRTTARLEMEINNRPTLVLLDERGFPSGLTGSGPRH